MRAILLNGPPGCGKDTIGAALAKHFPHGVLQKFASPIVRFMEREFAITMSIHPKDEPHPMLLGRTPRQAAIQYSEGFCKPLWGQDFFGVSAALRLRSLPETAVAIFTDSGFQVEAEVIAKQMKVLQITVARPGKTFDNDSRDYWSSANIGHIHFDNEEVGLDKLSAKIQSELIPLVTEWLNTL